jgi:threonine/homoserine/homoserine lactone efflux protein
MSLINGIWVGLILTLLLGPVFFTLLRASLAHGFKGGLTVAIGIIMSDILCIILCYYGAAQFIETEAYGPGIALLGAAILLGMGLKYLIFNQASNKTGFDLKIKDKAGLFAKGFLVNFVNPFVFVVWIGLLTYGKDAHGEGYELILFLLGVLISIFGTDLLKAYYAAKLERFLNPKTQSRINMSIGIVLLLFGIRMLWWAWKHF